MSVFSHMGPLALAVTLAVSTCGVGADAPVDAASRKETLSAGAVVPQLYVEYPRAAGQPAPLLKGYDKLELRPGESKRVSIALDQRAFSAYDASAGKWAVVPGTYRVAVGDSSVDAALSSFVQARAASRSEWRRRP